MNIDDTQPIEPAPVEPVEEPGDPDASQDDHLVEQTDNAPTKQDGDQADVSQDPTSEDDVDDDEEGSDGEPAP